MTARRQQRSPWSIAIERRRAVRTSWLARLIAAVAVLAWSITACAPSPAGTPPSSGATEPAGTAAEIAANVFAAADIEPFGDTVSIGSDEEMTYYLGSTNYPPFADSAVVLPLISIDARALYVLKTASTDDVEATLAQLKTDIDPARLICVNFAPGDVVTDSRGSVAFMVIDSDGAERTALLEAFRTMQ